MSCKFLVSNGGFFSNNYSCQVTGKEISAYTVNSLCNRDYYSCDFYKKANGGCYITSAVMNAVQEEFKDDCYELQTMRRLRDNWLRNQPDGDKIIQEYYELAPRICVAINEQPNSLEIYQSLYRKIQKCIEAQEEGNSKLAYQIYSGMVNELKEKFL